MIIKSLTVFCGSKNGNDSIFCEHARQLGSILAENNIHLIYGGGNKGVMGEIANAVLEKNGKVTGIMPRFLALPEHQHHGLTELIEVEDMHQRKRLLYEKCDAALVLAGGFGTMDELFEMLTWNQLRLHNKKIFIMNSAHFYDALIDFFDKMQEQSFLYSDINEYLQVLTSPQEFASYIRQEKLSGAYNSHQ